MYDDPAPIPTGSPSWPGRPRRPLWQEVVFWHLWPLRWRGPAWAWCVERSTGISLAERP